eukprot:CAMPEP_0183356798 /NCGR_PEP_ID=MMETSP0164_2-20130417/45200_1 /TAXON_ID=221442 /ORGANISM="Coccolithus pelagicus ssp braarudi, Strain PLY182g" /LENGTH=299 /DNA_ID=CAMNT_0025530297 /DNA_START=126 /DNA_END=1025 /DNA_ORIENTATION=+
MDVEHSSARYAGLHKVGEGSFGQVFRARDVQLGRQVALKKIRLRDVHVMPIAALRELRALQRLAHPNVMALHAFYTHGANLVLVLPYLPLSLAAMLEQRDAPLEDSRASSLAQMLMSGLAACHASRLLHRDIKPANLMLDDRGVLKIADFGQARLLPLDLDVELTGQVATRWYRAPELLFGSKAYTSAVDIWAAGCVIAQFWCLSPLLPGESDMEQIFQVMTLLGSPTEEVWPGGSLTPDFHKLELPAYEAASWEEVLPYAPRAALVLVSRMVCYDPTSRVSAADALVEPWLLQDDLPG